MLDTCRVIVLGQGHMLTYTQEWRPQGGTQVCPGCREGQAALAGGWAGAHRPGREPGGGPGGWACGLLVPCLAALHPQRVPSGCTCVCLERINACQPELCSRATLLI